MRAARQRATAVTDYVMAKQGRGKGRYRQATRLLRILDYLRARHFGATLEELANEFHVTERQIRRDVDAIDEAGYATTLSLTADGRARVQVEGTSARAVPLSLRERFGLLAVRRVFDVLAGTPFAEDVSHIYSKIAASLPDDQRVQLKTFGDRFIYIPDGGTKPYRGKEDVLDGLFTGVIHRGRVRYRYRPATGEAHAGVLEPYAMALYKHGLYVLGCATPDKTQRAERQTFVFAAERFDKAVYQRNQHFEVPSDFRVDEFFQGAFGIFVGGDQRHVVVDFAAPVRARAEARQWHRTQKLKPLPDGGVRLSFHASNLTQVVGWVLEWGSHARAVEPPALVSAVTRELRAATAHYSKR